MLYTYEEFTDSLGGKVIKRTNFEGQIAWIPTDLGNSDYQVYLRWLNGEEETGTIS